MKNVVFIIFAVLLTGCVTDRKSQSTIEAENILNCPELVEQAANNLEQLKVDQLLILAWKQNVLSKKLQPCSACQKLNVAALVLNDEANVYKPAMLEFIDDIGKEDPNTIGTVSKPYISASSIDDKKMKNYSLAQQYMNAIDELQTFLTSEIKMTAIKSRNFVLDNYFIPLLLENEKLQQQIQAQNETEPVEPEEQ